MRYIQRFAKHVTIAVGPVASPAQGMTMIGIKAQLMRVARYLIHINAIGPIYIDNTVDHIIYAKVPEILIWTHGSQTSGSIPVKMLVQSSSLIFYGVRVKFVPVIRFTVST